MYLHAMLLLMESSGKVQADLAGTTDREIKLSAKTPRSLLVSLVITYHFKKLKARTVL